MKLEAKIRLQNAEARIGGGTYATPYIRHEDTEMEERVEGSYRVMVARSRGRSPFEFVVEANSIPEALAAGIKLAAERETGLGAGTTFWAQDTGRFLFLKRSDQGDKPGTWCNCGGGVEAGETPEQGARREAIEEIGYSEPYDLIPMDVNTQPDGFTYHNFFSVVPTEFEPKLNDEHTDFMWANEMPEPMHPEYEAALLRWHQNHADAT